MAPYRDFVDLDVYQTHSLVDESVFIDFMCHVVYFTLLYAQGQLLPLTGILLTLTLTKLIHWLMKVCSLTSAGNFNVI